jgi:hypothetical protein
MVFKSIFSLTWAAMLTFTSINASEIRLEPSEKIVDVDKIDKYTLTTIYDTIKKSFKISIFDNNKNIVFDKSFSNGKVKYFGLNSSFTNAIYVIKIDDEKDKIVSINIESGYEDWASFSQAQDYELSPNGDYLLTNVPSISAGNQPFQIVSVLDGSILYSRKFSSGFYASWYDDDNVVFAIQEYSVSKNPDYIKIEELNMERTALIEERQLIYIKLKNFEISERDYLEQKRILDNKIQLLGEQLKIDQKTVSRNSGVSPGENAGSDSRLVGKRSVSSQREKQYEFHPAKIKIFNISSLSFTMDNSVFSLNGDPIYLPNMYVDDFLTVDNNKNVFFVGQKNNEVNKHKSYIVKLDKKLQLEWEYHIDHPYKMIRIQGNGMFYFGLNNGNIVYFINERGQKEDSQALYENKIVPIDMRPEVLFQKNRNSFNANDIHIDQNDNRVNIH